MSDDIRIDPAALQEIDTFETVAEAKEIHTESDEQDATRIVQMVKKRAKALDAQRRVHTKPLTDKKKMIDGLFRKPIARLVTVEKKLKMGVFNSVVAREARNREAMAAAQAAAQTGGNVSQHLDAIDDRPLPPSTSIRKRWEYRVVDASKVPENLWSPDPAKIEALLAKCSDFANPPDIPGVEVTVGGSVTVRGSKG